MWHGIGMDSRPVRTMIMIMIDAVTYYKLPEVTLVSAQPWYQLNYSVGSRVPNAQNKMKHVREPDIPVCKINFNQGITECLKFFGL